MTRGREGEGGHGGRDGGARKVRGRSDVGDRCRANKRAISYNRCSRAMTVPGAFARRFCCISRSSYVNRN